jgi:pimeloyl-ACP methyl ester carboxylesterase
VGALILLAPGVSGAPQVLESELRADEAAFWTGLEEAEAIGDLEALNEGEIRLWLDGLHAPHGRVDGDRRRLALDMNAVALAAASPGREPKVIDTWDRLGEIACPVLIVVGDLDMSHMQARARELTERIAAARLVVMEGAAHLPALEQPEAVATMMREFLSSLG